jgi:hypothetical protein
MVRDRVLAGLDQSVQLVALLVVRLPAGEAGVALLTVSGQGGGVDPIGLGQRAMRADERLDPAGIGAMGGDAGLDHGGKQLRPLPPQGHAHTRRSPPPSQGQASQTTRQVGSRCLAKAARSLRLLWTIRVRPSRLSWTTMLALS